MERNTSPSERPGEARTFARQGITDGWKRSPWFWGLLAASILVAVAGIMLGPNQVQTGYVLFALAFCGFVLVGVFGFMASLRSRRRRDEQLMSSP